MSKYKILVVGVPLIAARILIGCGDATIVDPESELPTVTDFDTLIDDISTVTADTVIDDSYVQDTFIDEEYTVAVEEQTVVEDLSGFKAYDMLEVTIDEIPFTLGDNLSDFISNLSIIGYRLSANTKGRNLSSGQSLEIPIVAKDNRTIGFLTIQNDDVKKHSMRTSPVVSLTVVPDQVLSVSAFGITQSSTFDDTVFLLGEADVSELTGLLYESDIGRLYCTYTANGEITGITVQTKGGVTE